MEGPVKSREGEHTSTTRWGPSAVLRRGNTHTTMAGARVPPDLTAFIRSRCGLHCQWLSFSRAHCYEDKINHRNKNLDIGKFWNEVERESLEIEHAKEKKQLQLDQVNNLYFDIVKYRVANDCSELQLKIARVMTKGTEDGVGNIMKNVNMELDESATYLKRRRDVGYKEDRNGYTTPCPSNPMNNPEDEPKPKRRAKTDDKSCASSGTNDDSSGT
ncbi:1973_t:CDS:2, partial [Funneliformis geosporum]